MTTYMQAGTCPRCGCPIYQPTVWHGILPPPATRGCACFPPSVRTVTTTNTRPLPAADQEDTDA